MDEKKPSIKKVLLLGSGGLQIGQAGEFDYSGSQAIKALKEEGVETILVNPNIATIQTDSNMADKLYLQPLELKTVSKIIQKEKPDGILLGFGGQTALNLGLELFEKEILKKYGVEVLGTPVNAIKMTEDRDLFKKELDAINVKTAASRAAGTVEEALKIAKEIGYPVMMRSGYSLGGLGSGIIKDEEELKKRAKETLNSVEQILIEECLVGWKEIEYEIVRDKDNNCITICNMENMDPMGIHTGESIVVAPSQTLNNKEYHMLREIAIKTVQHIGIVGECNIQYALNPENSSYRVIEINARLSRSSALASKATGYPLAFVAAKLSLGKRLDELQNAVTKKTSAFFEPALDYLVVKIPRWDINKLKFAERYIGSEMKSVGEVMAIGRSFPEALQKAIRMLNIGADGLQNYPFEIPDIEKEILKATDRRLFAIYKYFKQGGTVDKVYELSKIDKWFLNHLNNVVNLEKKLKENRFNKTILKEAKQFGFSDKIIGKIIGKSPEEIRVQRIEQGIIPVVKQIDTLSGEFPAETNYLYLTYNGDTDDIKLSETKPIIVLGSGPYCIGSSVEFDWCAVTTAKTLKKLGEKAIMINSNPETVSTDYDESDRLYFEELTLERIQDIADFEQAKGIVVSVGGQIANNVALQLHRNNYNILGTSPEDIDRAENRQKFSSLLNKLGIDQPEWEQATTLENAKKFIEKVGYPVLVRPSYVLSGSAMNIIYDEAELEKYLSDAVTISPDYPVVMSQFITGAKELEIDGVSQNGEIVIYAISEHVEQAGVHSGDATIVLPPQRLYLETIRRIKKISKKISKALNITGPFNIQFIAKENEIKVIECNVRSSRSFPFVSKITNNNFIEIATEIITNNYKSNQKYETLNLDYVGIKNPQFSYQRLKGANPVAHVEMASTGEVACIGDNYHEAFYTSWLATGQKIQGKKILLSIAGDKKIKLLPEIISLVDNGWEIYATEGTSEFLRDRGIRCRCLCKKEEKNRHTVLNALTNKKVDLVINIPHVGANGIRQTSGYQIRRKAIDHHIPLITNTEIARLLMQCLVKLDIDNIPTKSWQEYMED